jgi:hypothetical protein
MTLHITYNHQCPKCNAFYIPYGDAPCPNCGLLEPERFDFIPRAANSAMFNLRRHNSYAPAVWYVGTFGDHILGLLFPMLDQHRQDPSRPFTTIAREAVERMNFEEQVYLKEHLYNIAIRVYDEIHGTNNKESEATRQSSMSIPDLSWNRSSEIAPIIHTFWTWPSFQKQYQFYGTDRAINSCCDGWIYAYGHKKRLLENKRDFIVRTILGIPSFFIRDATTVFLLYPSSSDSHQQWLGTGQYSISDANEWIESIAACDPMMLLIQVDISPIYQTLKPLLQFSEKYD